MRDGDGRVTTDRASAEAEIKGGKRFAFGRNWSRFLDVLDEDRITEAESSLQEMLGRSRLDGLRFLDAGSGSGLFSLAAARLGARVHSFDFDPASVATTLEMRRRHWQGGDSWTVDQGSVLDAGYLASLGQFDIVYSWGVLHHTGSMWAGMELVASRVSPGGQLFIAIYNDQGLVSQFWRAVKRFYCSGMIGRAVVTPVFFGVFALAGLVSDVMQGRSPLTRYSEYRKKRGMSLTHDWLDWFGGFPYEVAKPGEVFDFMSSRRFVMERLVTCASLGCNEYVFRRTQLGPDGHFSGETW